MIFTGGMDTRLRGGQCVVNWALLCVKSNKVIMGDLLLTLQVASFFLVIRFFKNLFGAFSLIYSITMHHCTTTDVPQVKEVQALH